MDGWVERGKGGGEGVEVRGRKGTEHKSQETPLLLNLLQRKHVSTMLDAITSVSEP